MKNSKAYETFISQINASGSGKLEGYNQNLFDEIYDFEIEQVEDLIWSTFYSKHDTEILILFPPLKKYDGISALRQIIDNYSVPSQTNILISYLLYQNTEENRYLQLIEQNIVESDYNYTYIALVNDLKPSEQVYQLFVKIYKSCPNRIALSTCINGILFNKGFINNLDDLVQLSKIKELRKILKNVPLNERETMIEKLENGEFNQYKALL